MKRTLLLLLFVPMLLPVSALQVLLTEFVQPSCGHTNGVVGVGVFGAWPFEYLWNTGATVQDLENLGPGYYEVRVVDGDDDTVTVGWTLENTDYIFSVPSEQDGHTSCLGAIGGEVQVIEAGINGFPPYTYDPAPDFFDEEGDPVFYFPTALPGTDLNIQVTDATGCTGILVEQILAPQSTSGVDPEMLVTSISGSCSLGYQGSVTITNINNGLFLDGPQLKLFDEFDSQVSVIYTDNNTEEFTYLTPGSYHLVRDWDPWDYDMVLPCDSNPLDRIDFTIPDLGPNCGSVTGTVFIDVVQDCTQDWYEVGVPYQVLEIGPDGQYAITDADGSFSFVLAGGDYTLAQTDTNLVQLCPANAPVPFTVNIDPTVINLADSSTVPLDLSAQLNGSVMRPGYNGTFWGGVSNLSPQVSGPISITMELDADLVFTSAVPTPSSVVGNTIFWSLPSIFELQGRYIHVTVSIPADTPLGTPLSSTLSASNTLLEEDLGNNVATVDAVVVGSYDPNTKTARTSTDHSTTQYVIDEDEWIDYTIRFQNTGTDAAINLVITDTLSEMYDMASFQQAIASHPFSVAFKPGRVVEWTFANIYLPDSATNETLSHGLVAFRIRPKLPLIPGALIENTANIYFDFNEPVITEASVLTATVSTKVPEPTKGELVVVYPNPTEDVLWIELPADAIAVRVRSSDGRSVLERAVRGARVPLQVQHLPAGAYSLEVLRHGAGIMHARFIKR